METVSDNTAVKKRGRPRVLNAEEEAHYREVWPHLKTMRSLQNSRYVVRAMGVLDGMPGTEWLYHSQTQTLKLTLMGELGREMDPDYLVEMALKVCELKPASKEGRVMIRQWRTGKAHPAVKKDLTDRLMRTINEYSQAHPELTTQQVLRALMWAVRSVANQ
jgi:hypothetical protein